MSVELRCPDCRAKLRLPEEPEPGSEVECPECNAIFPAPDLETGETPDARPKKKAKSGDGKPAEKKPKAAGGKDKTPRKRKAKKKETNTAALIAVIAGRRTAHRHRRIAGVVVHAQAGLVRND